MWIVNAWYTAVTVALFLASHTIHSRTELAQLKVKNDSKWKTATTSLWLSAKFIDFLFHPEVNTNRHISRSTSIIYLSVHNQLRYKLRTAELRWQLRQRWRQRRRRRWRKKWLTLNERCTWYRKREEMEKETKLLMRRSVKVTECWIHEFARIEKW